MYVFKLLKPSFIFSFLFLGFIIFFLLKFKLLDFYKFVEHKGLLFSFISIYFLIDLNRIINLPYLKLIFYSSVLTFYFKSIGLLFFVVCNLFFIKYLYLSLFLRESSLMLSLIFMAAYLQSKNKKYWIRYLILSITYLLITSVLWK
jgi:hypothetical protein